MSSEQPEQAQESAEPLPDIAGYTVLQAIGHGGMSTVYLAVQASLGREVAVKVMLPEALADEVSRRRFENEVRTIARLEHPHIVGIFEVGRTRDGLPYYAMPHLSRGHLGQLNLTQNEPRVIAILRALLSALDYAHARGVIHRDVKAENVLFDEADRPLLADFGIALRHGYSPRVTMAGLAVGSTAYMAPEQARGENVDHRADLYSLGVLAFEMLAGRLPYVAGDALAMAMQHVQDPIPRLPREKRHWQRLIDKAMAKSPGARYRSAQQMLDALQRIDRKRQSAGFAFAQRIGDGVSRMRHAPLGVWIAAGLAAALLLGVGLRHYNRSPAPAEATAAVAPPAAQAPTPAAPAPQADLTSAMLRPPPESPAEPWMIAAEQQTRARNLIAPKGGNAYDSVLAAWRADPAHARLPGTVDGLIDAMTVQVEQRLKDGGYERVREYVSRAERIARETRRADSPALKRMQAAVAKALGAGVDAAAKRLDRNGAIRTATVAAELMDDKTAAAALMKRARDVGQTGDRAPDDVAGLIFMHSGGHIVAVARNEVSRGDYARFAAATGRPPALCRERASLLRVLAPRDWKTPGFAQDDGQAVVCVSWNDAQAYLRWLSERNGRRYRLPSAAEAAQFAAGSGKAVSEWLSDCSQGCRKRIAQGSSWRGGAGARPLDPGRGYDDVGFRVVRDP
ncbi:bifunctional serine/threonine-protein kinase/formylglycine-generating enzyme family protein [Luteimonas sp. SX5]|uniref:Bifunctional serine/threonine-protein kinase/formylglycine-generating enzyme family protein n=1 Tax=Luteimonas galliterrae TaxID=2940486 RepID=A0ABT0ME19_9GAMM|nr:bifunctional serine/threonine-protein kinase/formylglycine-generating enzyme family protein [Luteimonas galliterrae]MCL1633119.1 bifunctional serine/threonine-protein kinase/formylglycine-generating enzyme family protein [Luteimonas galliterrae]